MEDSTDARQRGRKLGKKIRASFYAAVLFGLLANPAAFMVLDKIFSFATSSVNELVTEGSPNLKGIICMSFIMFVLMIFVTY